MYLKYNCNTNWYRCEWRDKDILPAAVPVSVVFSVIITGVVKENRKNSRWCESVFWFKG